MHPDKIAALLEQVNAAWAVLDLCLVLYLGYYFYVGHKEHNITLRRWWKQDLPLGVQAAVAIFIFHMGDLGVRGLLWWARHELNSGWSTSLEAPRVPLSIFAVVAVFGILCKLRVFSRPWMGDWLWLLGAMLAVLAILNTRYFPW